MLAAGLESPYAEWLEKWSDRDDRGDRITTRVECGEYFEVRDDALRAHATQVDPDGFWFHVPLELQQKVWPTEDFELARSLVDSPVPGVRPVRRHPRDGRRALRRTAEHGGRWSRSTTSVTPGPAAWPARWVCSSSC